jgi:hypothetical protein
VTLGGGKKKNLLGKKMLSRSFYLYSLFRKYVSYGFPVINFCNPGVHYEMACITLDKALTLHPPTTNVTEAQKAVNYSGIKIFNNLPQNIKHLSQGTNKFKFALKKFLQAGSFYSCKEYFEWNLTSDLATDQKCHCNVILKFHCTNYEFY